MSFKEFLMDTLGTAASAGLHSFANALSGEEQRPEYAEDSVPVDKDYRFSGPKLILNRRTVKCPECGNENDHFLYQEEDKISCFLCDNSFRIVTIDQNTMAVNDRPVQCPVCNNRDAQALDFKRDTVLCHICNSSFRVKYVYYPDTGELLDD